MLMNCNQQMCFKDITECLRIFEQLFKMKKCKTSALSNLQILVCISSIYTARQSLFITREISNAFTRTIMFISSATSVIKETFLEDFFLYFVLYKKIIYGLTSNFQ